MFLRISVHNQTLSDKILCNAIHGDLNIQDIYQKACLLLKAANVYRKIEKQDDACLLHSALREQSCHWAFCKLLMMLYPAQLLKRDVYGKLPMQIISAARDLSDEDTFMCFNCITKYSELVHAEFLNGDTRHRCEHCLKHDPNKSISEVFYIGPIAQHTTN